LVACTRWSDEAAREATRTRAGAGFAAVKATAGERVPALRDVNTLDEVNAVLQGVGREMGNVPEYHAYRVTSVMGPASSAATG
jgi:hypothetical protein